MLLSSLPPSEHLLQDLPDTVGRRSGTGKQEVRCILGAGPTKTWGTDTLIQSGSLVAKTGGITWLLLSCTDDLWRHNDKLRVVKKQKNIARKSAVCKVPYFLQCGSRAS